MSDLNGKLSCIAITAQVITTLAALVLSTGRLPLWWIAFWDIVGSIGIGASLLIQKAKSTPANGGTEKEK